jgi:hypothetical protein
MEIAVGDKMEEEMFGINLCYLIISNWVTNRCGNGIENAIDTSKWALLQSSIIVREFHYLLV